MLSKSKSEYTIITWSEGGERVQVPMTEYLVGWTEGAQMVAQFMRNRQSPRDAVREALYAAQLDLIFGPVSDRLWGLCDALYESGARVSYPVANPTP